MLSPTSQKNVITMQCWIGSSYSCICTRDAVGKTMQAICTRKPMANNIGTCRKRNAHSVAMKLLKNHIVLQINIKTYHSTWSVSWVFIFWQCKHIRQSSQTKIIILENQKSFPYLPVDFPYCTAFSNNCLYSGILEAASKREGLVVASVGLYCSITEMRTSTRKNDQDE